MSSESTIKDIVDAKEAEKDDALETHKDVNLMDKMDGDPTQHVELKAEDKDDSTAKQPMNNTVVESEQQQNQVSVDNSENREMDCCDVQEKGISATNGEMHDVHEYKDEKPKSEDDLQTRASGEIDNDVEDNEKGSLVRALDDKSSKTEAEYGGKSAMTEKDVTPIGDVIKNVPEPKFDEDHKTNMSSPKSLISTPSKSFIMEPVADGYESGTEEEQASFAKDVETFYRENHLEYKAPKFYKEELNLLKLWRLVIKLGGYERVTSCKLWRQVGESFRPPKTCTTVSWTFRIFYEKALLEYERHKIRNGELPFSDAPLSEPMKVENQVLGSQALGSGRARRDAAARAMQGWHSQRLLGNGQDKNLSSTPKVDKQLKTNGLLKRKKPSSVERSALVPHMKAIKSQADSVVIDIGPPADWVKINVQRTNDCFEIYALVPGFLREEVHVQSDPAGRLIISGTPEQLDNPWAVTPFKKVVSLPSRIDPHQTSAVVTLHGQLFVRVPFEL